MINTKRAVQTCKALRFACSPSSFCFSFSSLFLFFSLFSVDQFNSKFPNHYNTTHNHFLRFKKIDLIGDNQIGSVVCFVFLSLKMSGGFRSSTIPTNVRKTIQNIKEITGNHSEDEIYAMLKECCMDPNETAQKLLRQDTFHEVKRRRDRKKENRTSPEIADSRWRSGPTERSGRGGRGNYASRYAANGAGAGRSIPAKENGISLASDKVGSVFCPSVVQEINKKDDGSSVTELANGPVDIISGVTEVVKAPEIFSGSVTKEIEPQSHNGGNKKSNMVSAANVEIIKPETSPGVDSPALDPVLVPSNNLHFPVSVGAVKRVGNYHSPMEPNLNLSLENKSIAGNMGGKSQVVGKNDVQSSSMGPGSSSSSRPSSNYGSRYQQALVSHKVGPNKEWKPKVINVNTVEGLKAPAASEGLAIPTEVCAHTQSVESNTDSTVSINKLCKDLNKLHVREAQHVIIPNHIHVPDAVRTSLSFGSFDSALIIPSKSMSESETENSKSISETEQGIEEIMGEEATSKNNLAPGEGADYADYSQSPKQVESLSSGDVSAPASSVVEFCESKETDSGNQHSSVHSSAGVSFGLMPPMLENPLGSGEVSDNQERDAARASSIVVQQPVDPSIFYTQYYCSGADSDARVSPFPIHEVASKYSGNVAVLSSQPPTEGGNPLVLPTAAQTPLATQAAGVMQNSIAVTQHPIPIFRQPAGVHLPHYPPNYVPYGHYFPPFYAPLPSMPQFLGNNAFPQQAQEGSVYPVQPVVAVTPTAVKFPMSQCKPAGSAGNSMHMGMTGGYGPYGTSQAGYNSISVTAAGNSTANEDLIASQSKDNNLYITGQQSEGPAVWIPALGRDISSLPVNSFYNLSPQGQHVTFAPTQAGQGTFAGLYHPAQAVTATTVHPHLQQTQPMPGVVDMMGATASVYQHPQHAQINWPNNF
ncbi:GBF-interacting protein 1-like isoform X4 [Amaranthus tricolor]|uniref:GBF-interacting protein 1-like isoform X4 n=1 Tax=Amaranthus tricolor TaxID=29722 RepID=UPI00258891C8|nr:GBF-interacting protein 1-like isoform X4 [Amaranthus tricolor]